MQRNFGRVHLALTSLVLLATASGAFAQASQPASGPAPSMVLKETTFNAGDTPKGDVIEYSFVVENEGDADLQILQVKPACGCTTPGFDKIIPPGGSGKITLKVDTARFKGRISKNATVTTNDPARPNTRLVINANVTTFIDVLPSDSVTFRQFRGEVKKKEITIHSNEETPLEIKDVQVNGNSIEHELDKLDDGDYKLTLWLGRTAPIGNVSGSVKLLTNSGREPTVTVTVRGNVLGQITLSPSTLYFRVDGGKKELEVTSKSLNMRERGELDAGVVVKLQKGERLKVLEEAGEWSRVATRGGAEGWVFNKLVEPVSAGSEPQTKVLNVSHRKESNFSIKDVKVSGGKIDASALDIKTEAVREGKSYRVTVTYKGSLTKGNYTGKLILETSDPEESEVEVPIYIVVV